MRRLLTVLALVALAAPAAVAAPPGDRSIHLIYLHGRIVQDQQSERPRHPEHGYYELAAIADALRERGFVVTADVRPKGSTVTEGADKVVAQIRALAKDGVSPDRVVVVGASMGAAIALRVAARLREPEVRYVLLGPCASRNIPALHAEENAYPVGRLLMIREESDVPTSDCPAWTDALTTSTGIRPRELVIETGLRHGFLYRPLPAWLDPATEWIREKAR